MKKLALTALLSWWFLVRVDDGRNIHLDKPETIELWDSHFAVIGPFGVRFECDRARQWVSLPVPNATESDAHIQKTECWHESSGGDR